MAIITITSDFGLKDHYVSSIKGAILSRLPDINIVDISHQIPTYNIQDAAYILKNAYPNFPKGSIHIIGVKTEQNNQSSPVIVYSDGHYFISSDNGVFSLLLETAIDKIIELPAMVSTFPTRDIFAIAAVEIAAGTTIENLGKTKDNLLERMPFRAASMGDIIRGTIEYIDSYGNLMSNISEALFNQVGKGREFKIEFARYDINKISKTYSDVPEGEILALFNSTKQLEISMNSDKANTMLGLKLNDSITVHFQ